MKAISTNALRIEGQPMFKVLEAAKQLEAQGRDIIHLEIGDPDFSTPQNIIDAAKSSLEQGETHYGSSWGNPEFIEVIQKATAHSRGFLPDKNQILVVPGANIGIFYAVFCLANAGQEVLVPDPGFPTYNSSIKMCGAELVPYPLYEKNEFRIRASDIEPLITSKTRLIIINSPQNPTGSISEQWALEEVYALAKKYDLYIYSDEIYARMVYGHQKFYSVSSIDHCQERVILSNGFSKAFAMTGWRLGALIAPPIVAERMMMLLQTTSSCVSTFVQRAGIEAITGNQEKVSQMMHEYEARRDLLVNGLNEIPGITCHTPGGAFYAFANIKSFNLSSEDFADYILHDSGVALLPGSNFGAQGQGFVRLCYANSRINIIEAISRIKQSCEKLKVKAKDT